MAIITTPYIHLSEGNLFVTTKEGTELDLHHQQGDIDGACSVYSLVMCLLHENIVTNTLAKGRTNGDRLLRELFDNHGLIRPGFYFKDLKAIIDRYKKNAWFVELKEGTTKQCVDGIRNAIDNYLTPIIGIDYCGHSEGHALLAVAYEYNEETEKTLKIYCLDPGSPTPITSIWNSYIDVQDLRKPSTYVNSNPKFRPIKVRISDFLLIHNKDLDCLL